MPQGGFTISLERCVIALQVNLFQGKLYHNIREASTPLKVIWVITLEGVNPSHLWNVKGFVHLKYHIHPCC